MESPEVRQRLAEQVRAEKGRLLDEHGERKPMHTHTRTFATLGVSQAAFTEICEAFRKLGKDVDASYWYQHAHDVRSLNETPKIIDMAGIALVVDPTKETIPGVMIQPPGSIFAMKVVPDGTLSPGVMAQMVSGDGTHPNTVVTIKDAET